MQYWLINLKCYSDQQLGAIQIELTSLKLRITEDSAKQFVNCLQFTEISMIGLLGERNTSYVLPAHFPRLFTISKEKLKERSVKLLNYNNSGVNIGVYKPYNWVTICITE